MKNVTIVGGGLAGLVTAIQLARNNIPVKVFEKKSYPQHRVCGEYISNETLPFLESLQLFPQEFDPPRINRFQLTSVNGKSASLDLDLGGFGISRHTFDHWLYRKALAEGVEILTDTEVTEISYKDDQFEVHTLHDDIRSDVVVGSFGKRSKLDLSMDRNFIKKRSPYIGVKYHVRLGHPENLIALHNFKNGYCGISNVENKIVNLCYLSHRSNLKLAGSIAAMEESILFQNPFIKNIFESAEFIFDAPITINEISFETKQPVENHVLMCGDAAGMITPLCGNGMAMAIHSSKILSQLLIKYCKSNAFTRKSLEETYVAAWTSAFAARLRTGRMLQRLFGSTFASDFAVGIAKSMKPVATWLVSKSHGRPF